MKKNAHIHLLVESELLEKIKKQAEHQELTISELCRQRLKDNSQLDRIELLLENISKLSFNRGGEKSSTKVINSQGPK